MPTLRIAMAQLNVTVGDLGGNAAKVADAILRAEAWQTDIVLVPELALTGYPPEDLLLKPAFIEDNLQGLRRLHALTHGITALVGFVDRDREGRLYNAAAVISRGRHVASYHKQCLPNYGVFDERRYFAPGGHPLMVTIGGLRLGVTICEDLWEAGPAAALAKMGAQAILNLSASPYHAGKHKERERIFSQRARTNRVAIAYCNLVGGQDELVFDGSSVAIDASGRVLRRGRAFQEDLVLVDLPMSSSVRPVSKAGALSVSLSQRLRARPALPPASRTMLDGPEEIYEALVLGTRDYVRKNGFTTVVLGLSGGIDSSLTACLAVDALGADHVVGVVMPSRFSSPETQADAREVAKALGMRCEELSIEPCFQAFLDTVRPVFGARPDDITEQNLQARIRGTLLMALSNKFGWLVLTTGNKSEMATGYTTLYGDMAGGFAVIKDVPKTLVYQLARLHNRRAGAAVIPERVFRRAPTAELAPNQTDQDTLPPYPVLDRILKAFVEDNRGLEEIVRRNHAEPSTVRRTIRMIDRSEYKRRQGPPGVKITPRAFGKDRRMPITNRYQEA